MKNLRDINKYKTWHFIIIILLITIIIPPLATLPTFIDFFDFSDTGNIGDTIGGITAPFINGLAAILLFLAFKEQIKANEIFKSQAAQQTILEEIRWIEKFEPDLGAGVIDPNLLITSTHINNNLLEILKQADSSDDGKTKHVRNQILKITYLMTQLNLTYSLIKEYQRDKEFLYKKVYHVHTFNYASGIKELEGNLKKKYDLIKNIERDEKLLSYVMRDFFARYEILEKSMNIAKKHIGINDKRTNINPNEEK